MDNGNKRNFQMNSKNEYIITKPLTLCKPDPRGLGVVYFENMKKFGDIIAQIDGATGQCETFSTLLEKSINTAVELKNRGFGKEDIISICSYNHLNSIVPFIASQFLGCKVSSFDPTLSLEDTIHLMKQIPPNIIFVSDNAEELIARATLSVGITPTIVTFGPNPSCTNNSELKNSHLVSFEEFLKPHSESKNFLPSKISNCKDTAIIIFSSGTTGTPKGICLNHFSILGQSEQCNEYLIRNNKRHKITYTTPEGKSLDGVAKDPTLSFASLYWISTVLFLTSSMLDGYTRVIPRIFNPQWAWEYLEKYKVGTIFVAPYQLFEMIAVKPPNLNLPHLQTMLYGGTPISEEQVMTARKVFPNCVLIQGYGQTEVSGCFTMFKHEDPKDIEILTKKPKSCGKIIPGFTCKIVDTTTEEKLGPYQPGELRVKSDFEMNGYYKIDSSDVWDDEGFLKTGDVMYYDEDFCFYHVDRIKEMLKYKSWHVAPASLEAILHTHPAVANGVVVGLPHPEDGDHPLAFVVLKKGAQVEAEDILEYVNERVDDRHKLRGGILFIDELPLTPTGKVKRRDLRDMAVSIKT